MKKKKIVKEMLEEELPNERRKMLLRDVGVTSRVWKRKQSICCRCSCCCCSRRTGEKRTVKLQKFESSGRWTNSSGYCIWVLQQLPNEEEEEQAANRRRLLPHDCSCCSPAARRRMKRSHAAAICDCCPSRCHGVVMKCCWPKVTNRGCEAVEAGVRQGNGTEQHFSVVVAVVNTAAVGLGDV